MPATTSSLRHLARAVVVVVASAATLAATRQTGASATGVDLARLARVDAVIDEAIAAGNLPGAVLIVGRGDTIVWRKAYGRRAVTPAAERMTVDTIFDLASLTKVVATAPVVMQLVEQGRVRLNDPVSTYVPGFDAKDKAGITILDLLTHMSGLPPDLDRTSSWSGRDTALRMAADVPLAAAPGERFIYSDINFLLLGAVAERVTGEPLDAVARDRVFTPLRMRDTMFLPPARLLPRIAPTDATTTRGQVHDPTAQRMSGVAGHAGLFSTADDLARFCRMMLHGGALDGARVLAPLTVARMTSPATPAGERNLRGLGWDLNSTYSSNRGDLLPLGSYGHTGFTGGSIWIDPATRVFIVLLSNRVHPNGGGNVVPLRARVATIVAASLVDVTPATASAGWHRPNAAVQTPPVMTGLDVLRASGFAAVRGLRVGLLTNQTGVARDGASAIDLLAHAPGVTLVSLFSPEHGIRGVLDASVPSTTDERTGLPIHSLYGATERPTPDMLTGLDAIVIDLQDAGARFYTYVTTMAYVMEAAAAAHVKVIVLDRPNPIGGLVEGPALDDDAVGFTGYFPAMPIRHGLTIGEIAALFNGERHLGADLQVVAMTGWRRDEWFDETGLPWINPSPNMRTLYAAALYPGIGALERTNLSVGRGTDTPFEHIGAPWIDGTALASALDARGLPGVRVYPESFTPASSTYANERCQGVFFVVTDRDAVRPVRLAVEVAAALLRLFPGRFEIDRAASLFGSKAGLARVKAGDDPAAIAASWTADESSWRARSARYLLY